MSHPTFVFDSYRACGDELEFNYSYKDGEQVLAHFSERYKLPVSINNESPVTKYILQQIHIIVGVSYYKSLLGKVEMPYELDEAEAAYWNTVYDEGLGEFAFNNQISSTIRPFEASGTLSIKPVHIDNDDAILGIGGGKDSVTGGELLKRLDIGTTTMDIATRDNHGQAGAVMDIMGLPQLRMERYLDTSIVEFTEKYQGYHGHIPFSAILAWLGVLMAYTLNKRYVVMANEAASSIGNVEWNGRLVNHQWSKSFQFEKLTQQLVHSHVSEDLWYFSPIRPYSSIAVIALFVRWGKAYLGVFTSCNLVLRIDPAARPNTRWCGKCAKCLSTWLLMSIWLSEEELVNIFGTNMFEDVSLQPTLRELLELEGHKPLDCVGTSEELRAAARQAIKSHTGAPLLNGIDARHIPGPEIDELIHSVGPHNIPEELSSKILGLVSSKLT